MLCGSRESKKFPLPGDGTASFTENIVCLGRDGLTASLGVCSTVTPGGHDDVLKTFIFPISLDVMYDECCCCHRAL